MPRKQSTTKQRKGAQRTPMATNGNSVDDISANPRSCIVIGAGLSGLAAGHALTKGNTAKKFWDVTVLEAEKWTGGRVYSYSFPEEPGLVCELGGEWIGDDHDAIIKLCEDLNLETIPHRFDFFFFENGIRGKQYRAGDSPFDADIQKKFDQLMKQTHIWGKAKKMALDKKDWWTLLRDLHFDEDDLLRRDLMDSTDFGESIRHSGGYSAASEYSDSDRFDEMDMKIVGGNHKLVDALEQAIRLQNGRILTRHHVTVIQQTGSPRRVIVRTADGKTFRAHYCICTVPARTLTKIDFTPKLPDLQWDAAKQLQYCRIMKTAILCETRFWMEHRDTRFSCFSDATSDFVFDATLGQCGRPGGPGILCSYAIGDKADDLWSYPEEDLIAKLEHDLKAIFPTKPVHILKIRKQGWQHNKLTEGAYAFYRPGQWFTVREILATRFKNVLFAGEHIADEQGFMDGAIDTGQDAAGELMQHFKKPRKKRK
jgi:monoamine oxidase